MPPLRTHGTTQIIAVSAETAGHSVAGPCCRNAAVRFPGRRGKIRSTNLSHFCTGPASADYLRGARWLRPVPESSRMAGGQRNPYVRSHHSRNGGHCAETRFGSRSAGFESWQTRAGGFGDGSRDYAENARHCDRASFWQPRGHGPFHRRCQTPRNPGARGLRASLHWHGLHRPSGNRCSHVQLWLDQDRDGARRCAHPAQGSTVLGENAHTAEDYPMQSRAEYFHLVFTHVLVKLFTIPLLYGLFYRACVLLEKDFDQVINAVRNLPPEDEEEDLVLIRKQPSAPLLALLLRRLRTFSTQRLRERREVGRQFPRGLPPGITCLGSEAPFHSYWVFPVLVEAPERFATALRKYGFDATTAGSA